LTDWRINLRREYRTERSRDRILAVEQWAARNKTTPNQRAKPKRAEKETKRNRGKRRPEVA